MATVREEQMVFAVSPGNGDGVPLVLLGIPAGAWEYMKDGKTHSFDLTKVGLPIKLMLFGAADHAEAMKIITADMASAGVTVRDERRRDFSIEPTGDRPVTDPTDGG